MCSDESGSYIIDFVCPVSPAIACYGGVCASSRSQRFTSKLATNVADHTDTIYHSRLQPSTMDGVCTTFEHHPILSSILVLLIISSLSVFVSRISSPISHLPGPYITKLSILPIVHQDSISNRTAWSHSLHKQYGPIVRLSPKEISVCSSDAIRHVFTGSSKSGYYSKAPMFNIFQHFGARNAFSSITSEAHGWRRRIVAGNYALTAIVAKEMKGGKLWRCVGEFLDMIDREGAGSEGSGDRAFDVFSACRFFAADCVTSHLFVHGSNALGGDEEIRRYIEDSAEGPDDVLSYFKMEFEGVHSTLRWILGLLGIKKGSAGGRSRPATASGKKVGTGSSEWVGGTPIRDWGWKRFLETRKAVAEGAVKPSIDVAAQLASNAIQGDKLEVSKEYFDHDAGIHSVQSRGPGPTEKLYYRNEGCASECMDQFLAGLDTVGDTLAYIFHLLSLPENERIQAAVRAECASLRLPDSFSQPLSHAMLSNILSAPWIDAVLKETLRVYPASTTAFQRVVPSGGRVLDGFYIPGGTIVGGSPVTVNRDPSVFGVDVDSWSPSRWLQAVNVEEMNRRLWTFGSGGRGCVGRHLAMSEMKLLLVGVYSKFSTEVDERADVMRVRNHPGSRTTFRDMGWFREAKGILRFTNEASSQRQFQ